MQITPENWKVESEYILRGIFFFKEKVYIIQCLIVSLVGWLSVPCRSFAVLHHDPHCRKRRWCAAWHEGASPIFCSRQRSRILSIFSSWEIIWRRTCLTKTSKWWSWENSRYGSFDIQRRALFKNCCHKSVVLISGIVMFCYIYVHCLMMESGQLACPYFFVIRMF